MIFTRVSPDLASNENYIEKIEFPQNRRTCLIITNKSHVTRHTQYPEQFGYFKGVSYLNIGAVR